MSDHPVPEEVRTKALAVLREGRLRILGLRTSPAGRLEFVDAVVYGHRREHSVGFTRDAHGQAAWTCSCPDAPPCSHLFAAELVAHGVMPPGRPGSPKARPARREKVPA